MIRSPKGWGVDVQTAELLVKKNWMRPPLERFGTVVSYQDQVVELPPGSEVLASNDHCPYFMVQVGGHILGIQGHPEASKAFVKALISSREDRLGGDTVARALTSLEQPVHSESVASWILNFLKL